MNNQSSIRHLFFTAAFAALVCPLTNCALQKSVTKQESTAFLRSAGVSPSSKIARLPFEHSWRDRKVDPNQYSRLVLHPVSLRYLRNEQWQQSESSFLTTKQAYQAQANDLAQYWNKSLVTAFGSPNNRLKLAHDTSVPGTLVAEIAITEIVFSHPDTYALSWALPGGGIAEGAMFAPSVAFEAVVRDAATGKIVATAADRRSTKIKLVDFNRLTVAKPNREICDEWSQQFMQAFNKELFPSVKRSWVGLY